MLVSLIVVIQRLRDNDRIIRVFKMTKAKMKNNYENIQSLQVIRGIAAILVFLYHGTGIIKENFGYHLAQGIFAFGYSGVDIFFVLSGFIIFYTSENNNSNNLYIGPKEFLLKRFLRIYPIYWVAVGFTLTLCIIGDVFFHTVSSSTMGFIEKGGVPLILKSIFLLPNGVILGVAWTLIFEVMFYILFGIFYFLSKRLFFTVMTLIVIISILSKK